MQFGINITNIASDGVEADMAICRDHFIAVAFYEILQHFLFAIGEMILEARGFGGPEGLQHFFCDDRGEGRAAVEHVLDGLEQVDEGGILQDIAICSAAKSLNKSTVVF